MKTTTYLTNLTPLRGIAALLTVIFHADLYIGFGRPALTPFSEGMLVGRMYLMVDFFFILSGFIMCHVYGNWFAGGVTGNGFGRFLRARFARVYPLHVFTLFVCAGIWAWAAGAGLPRIDILEVRNDGYSFFTNLLLLHSMNLHDWFSWNHASWSISTEWWAYIVFPFLVAPFMKLGKRGAGIAAVLCFAGYAGVTFFLVPLVTLPPEIPFARVDPALHTINVSYQYGIFRCLFGFILGMMMYRGFQSGWGKALLANGWVLLALFVGMLLCFQFMVPDVFTVTLFPLMLLGAAYGSKGMNRLFGTNAMQRLGDWSFSIYLAHQPLAFFLMTWMAQSSLSKGGAAPQGPPAFHIAWIICLAYIALVLLLSWLTYRWVEVPARGWINPAKRRGAV